MDLENKNLKWRISRRIPNSPVQAWGSIFFGGGDGGGWGVNCLEVMPLIPALILRTIPFYFKFHSYSYLPPL